MWTLGLYFATEAHVDFEDTDRSDFVKFWLLFVGTTVIRFSRCPVPVLWGSIKGVMRDAEFHHRWHLQYRRRPRRNGSGRSSLSRLLTRHHHFGVRS